MSNSDQDLGHLVKLRWRLQLEINELNEEIKKLDLMFDQYYKLEQAKLKERDKHEHCNH